MHVIGRGSRGRETYPVAPAAPATPPPGFARNFASGPANQNVPITAAGTHVTWGPIESEAPQGIDVPITPQVSGRVCASGVIVVHNVGGAPGRIDVQLQFEGQSVITTPLSQMTIAAGEFASIPYALDLSKAFTPVGSTANVEALITASADNLFQFVTAASTIILEEVPEATG